MQKLIKENAWVIFCLFALTTIATLLRSYNSFWGEQPFYFGSDDTHHLFLSGLRLTYVSTDWGDIIQNSYRDCHPPLRDLVLNFIMHNVDSVYLSRLIGFIPGVLLVPASFFLGYSLSYKSSKFERSIIGLSLAFVTTFMDLMVDLSISTRPYMLMALIQVVTLICLLRAVKTTKVFWFTSFYIFAFITLFSDYGVIFPIGIYNLILILYSFTKVKKNLKLVIIGSIVLLASVLFQGLEIKKNNGFERYKFRSFLESHYIKEVKQIPVAVINFFDIFARVKVAPPSIIQYLVFAIYLAGLIFLYRDRSYVELGLALLPIISAIILSYTKYYPFYKGWHSVSLIPSVFIAYAASLEKFLKLKPMSRTLTLLVIFMLSYPYALGVFVKPEQYYQKFVVHDNYYLSVDVKKNDLERLEAKLFELKNDDNFIVFDNVLGHLFEIYYRMEMIDIMLKDERAVKDEIFRLKRTGDYCYHNDNDIHREKSVCRYYNENTKQKLKKIIVAGKVNLIQEVIDEVATHGYTKEVFSLNDAQWQIREFALE